MTDAPRPRLVAMIPTYNEAGTIGPLAAEILALDLPAEAHVLVVDDDSPDGTAEIVRRAAAAEPRLHLFLRTERRGRGSAGIDGFRASLGMGADFVVEMDGDLSHQPRFIPALLAAAGRADIAIGSRFVPGGSDADRGLHRRLITRLVRLFIRGRFRTRVRDVSSGFRLFRREALEAVGLDGLRSTGPSIVLEILYRAGQAGLRLVEVPIEFVDRRAGRTKLGARTLLATLRMALRFRRIYGPPGPGPAAGTSGR